MDARRAQSRTRPSPTWKRHGRGHRACVESCKAALAAIACSALASVAGAQPAASLLEWSGLSGDGARSSTRWTSISSLGAPRWIVSQTLLGEAIQFVGPAGVAATALPLPRVFATGVVGAQTRAIALDAESGQIAWMTPLPSIVLDSWSMPALDASNGTVIYATGGMVTALRMIDGSQAWQVALLAPPVNVGPLVTEDLGPRNRVFVTDYGGFGSESVLTCINISPRHQTLNAFDPGQVLWSVGMGSALGASPAYLDGVVYVASTGLDGSGAGEIRAFDARALTAPSPLWVFVNPINQGLFGGVTVRESTSGVRVYAASYATQGSIASANLVKVRASDGTLVWSVSSNRTDSIPIVLPDGRIALSSGIQGFGSVPMVQLFDDHGTFASELWSTATSTWIDANANGILELGEFLLVGGWTTHPVLTIARTANATPRLLVGSLPTSGGTFGAYTRLSELDLSLAPSQPGFVVQATAMAGSTPAMLGSGVYSVGTGGLAALGAPPPRADLDGDSRVTIDDLCRWEHNTGGRDVDRDGAATSADKALLLFELRRNEHRGLVRGRGGL